MKTVVFNTVYLDTTGQIERYYRWFNYHTQIISADFVSIADGGRPMSSILPSPNFAYIEMRPNHIGRRSITNWAGLRVCYAELLRQLLEKGYESFAYVEIDTYIRRHYGRRIIDQINNGVKPDEFNQGYSHRYNQPDTSLHIMGYEVAAFLCDYFSHARAQFSDTCFEQQFKQIFNLTPDSYDMFKGEKLESCNIEDMPVDAEYLTQVDALDDEKVKAFLEVMPNA